MSPALAGLLVHIFTACGAGLGLAALFFAIDGQFVTMFAWLGAAFIVDAVDGALARRFNVVETSPHIDGVVLDLVVDFLTYVVVPLVALWRSNSARAATRLPFMLHRLRGFGALFRRSAHENNGSMVSWLSGRMECAGVLPSRSAAATIVERHHHHRRLSGDVRASDIRASVSSLAMASCDHRYDNRLGTGRSFGSGSGSLQSGAGDKNHADCHGGLLSSVAIIA